MSTFVARCQPLYGVTAATFNVHQLLHLSNSVPSLGPLWAHSAFVFEGGNGKLVKSVTAARGLPQQIVERVVMVQQLENFIAIGGITEEEKAICDQFLGHPPVVNAAQEDGATLLSHNKHATLTASEKAALNQVGCDPTQAECYERLIYDKQVYHSILYRKPTKSDSSFVSTSDGYFRIEKVVHVPFGARRACFLLCREVVVSDCTHYPEHIKPCFLSGRPELKVLRPREIKSSCIYIEFCRTQTAFVCFLPNMIERD